MFKVDTYEIFIAHKPNRTCIGVAYNTGDTILRKGRVNEYSPEPFHTTIVHNNEVQNVGTDGPMVQGAQRYPCPPDLYHVTSFTGFFFDHRRLTFILTELYARFQCIGNMRAIRISTHNKEWIKGVSLITLRGIKPSRDIAVIECTDGYSMWSVQVHKNGRIDVYALDTDTWNLEDVEEFLHTSYTRLDTDEYVHSTRTITTQALINDKIDIQMFYENVRLERYETIDEGLLNVQIPQLKDDESTKTYRGTLTKKSTIKPKTNKKARSNIANQVSAEVRVDGTIVNVKLFRNSVLQMTGLKNHDQSYKETTTKILKMYYQKLFSLGVIQEIPHELPSIYPIMIKGSFGVGYKVDRYKLFKVMSNGYGLWVNFDRNITKYQLVKIFYYYNEYNDGKCHCTVSSESKKHVCNCQNQKKKQRKRDKCQCQNEEIWCRGKKKNWLAGGCKCITAMVASTGKVNLAGGVMHEHQLSAYNFLRSIFDRERDNIEAFDPSSLADE